MASIIVTSTVISIIVRMMDSVFCLNKMFVVSGMISMTIFIAICKKKLRIRNLLLTIEFFFSLHFIRLKIRTEVVDNVLHGSVITDVVEGMTDMDNDFTGWAGIELLEMSHQATLTNCGKRIKGIRLNLTITHH
jgi:hypothetical protein